MAIDGHSPQPVDKKVARWVLIADAICWVVGILTLACGFLGPSFDYVQAEEISTFFTGAVLTALAFVGYATVCYVKYGSWPWCKVFLRATLITTILFPLMVGLFVGDVNYALDRSPEVERITTVIDTKWNQGTGSKGRRWDSYRVVVKSWRSDMDAIDISVSKSEYLDSSIGDEISVRTRSGFFGWEYVVPCKE